MSSIKIIFNSSPDVDAILTIRDSLRPSIDMAQTFVSSRSSQGQTAISNSSGATAQNYRSAMITDYNGSGLYTISYNNAEKSVTVTANNPQSNFSLITSTNGNSITTEIDNDGSSSTVFNIESVEISEAANPCENVRITVTSNQQATSMTSPFSQVVSSNPFTFDTTRPTTSTGAIAIKMQNANGTDTASVNVPRLAGSLFSVAVISTPSEAQASVDFLDTRSLVNYLSLNLEYSLDNINWQPSNDFYGLSVGDYTAFVRDKIGCVVSKDFQVEEFVASIVDYSPLAYISNLNSIRYKLVEQWDDSVRKNPLNTLSYEERDKRSLYYEQLFKPGDNQPTQVKTTYGTVTASYFDCSGNETSLQVNKLTDNLDYTDVRDATLYPFDYLGTQYLAVRFQTGSVYDSVTLDQTDSYNLGESTPYWMDVDEFINVEGVGWMKIIAKEYDSDNGTNNLVLNRLVFGYASGFGTKKITSVYNKVNHEVWQFDYDMPTGRHWVKVIMEDAEQPTVTWVSEWISVRENLHDHYLIEYYNSENNDVNYATGIAFKLRIPYIKQLKWTPSVDRDIYVTDTRSVLTSSLSRDFYEMLTRPLPTAIAQKLVLALQQDRLRIENQMFLLEGEPEVIPMGSSNMYQVRADLVESEYVFDNYQGGFVEQRIGELLVIDDEAGGFLLVD